LLYAECPAFGLDHRARQRGNGVLSLAQAGNG